MFLVGASYLGGGFKQTLPHLTIIVAITLKKLAVLEQWPDCIGVIISFYVAEELGSIREVLENLVALLHRRGSLRVPQ